METAPAPTHPARPPEERNQDPSPRRTVIPSMDGMRGLAALAVLLYHVAYLSGRPELGDGTARRLLISGYVGVDFFFVISGFLLFLPVVVGGSLGNLRAYARRRAARILPAYYVALLGTTALLPLLTSADVDRPHESVAGAGNLLLHLTFLQHSVGLALGLPEGFGVNGVVWTLALEVTFYLLLPLVAVRFLRHPWRWLGGALAASAGYRAWVLGLGVSTDPALPGAPTVPGMAWITQIPSFLTHFALGMVGAWLFVRCSRSPRFAGARWLAVPTQAAALALVLWGMYSAGSRDLAGAAGAYDHWPAGYAMVLGFALLLVATALAPAWSQYPWSNRAMRRLGDVSYGIYLWHLPLAGLALTSLNFAGDSTDAAFWILLGFVLPGSLIMGWLSHRFIEVPAMNWARRPRQPRRLGPRQSGPRAPLVPAGSAGQV